MKCAACLEEGVNQRWSDFCEQSNKSWAKVAREVAGIRESVDIRPKEES